MDHNTDFDFSIWNIISNVAALTLMHGSLTQSNLTITTLSGAQVYEAAATISHGSVYVFCARNHKLNRLSNVLCVYVCVYIGFGYT